MVWGEGLVPWVIFLLSAAVIVYAATKLSRYGGQIAGLTGLGGLWIGVVLMAAATSLPEVFTTITASVLDEPDLAAGNLFGAGLTNMLTLGLIDLLHRPQASLAIGGPRPCLECRPGTLPHRVCRILRALRFGCEAWVNQAWQYAVAASVYLRMRLVFRQESMKRRQREQDLIVEGEGTKGPTQQSKREGLRRAFIGFAMATLALLLSAPFLAGSASKIARQSGISTTFIGTSLVAIATALPEFVTAITAVWLGAFDLAVGNLFGSNAFNMAAFFFVDIAYRSGPLFNVVSHAHAMTALWSTLLMSIGLMGIIYRVEERYRLIEPDGFLIILGYCLGLWLLFQ